ncbi:hypothetical protein B4U79_16769, partial [Dinothrombium tinctorium]
MVIDWKIPFEERLVPIFNVKQLVADGKLLEMFSSGHQVMVTPIVEINYDNEVIKIPTIEQKDPLYLKLFYEFQSYFFGRK